MMKKLLLATAFSAATLGVGHPAHGQVVLGTFEWNLGGFCNVFTITVLQLGPETFALHGEDDACGEPDSATLTGTAAINGEGRIDLGLSYSGSGATFISHIHAELEPGTITGPWSDDLGGSGTLTFLGASAARAPGSHAGPRYGR